MNVRKLLIMMVLLCNVYANTTLEKLNDRMVENNTLVCVGLDPDLSKIPCEITEQNLSAEEKVYLFLTQVVDLTAEHVCAYKIQKAFYDGFREGHALLQNTIAYIKERHPEIPLFIDCKIGDIGNTMQVYMHNLFDQIKGDGVVVNPYMGDDVFEPFLEDKEKVGLVLVQTSNPSAKIVQELPLETGEFLWEKMLTLTLDRWNKNQNLIPIISSNTHGYDYKSLRKKIPKEVPILLVGVGAQGGNLSVLKDLLNEEKTGVFINSSRDILYPYQQQEGGWREKIVEATLRLKEAINQIRYSGTKFLLLVGPSGIGKSSVIRELEKLDSRFVYIKPFTTRELRLQESDKIHLSLEEMLQLEEEGRLIAINQVYGNYYATPLDPIIESLQRGFFPVIDWPVEKVEMMKERFGDQVVSVYLFTEEKELFERLQIDGRDVSGDRFSKGREEIASFFKGAFDDLIDYKVENKKKDKENTAQLVYNEYIKSLTL